VTNLTQAQREIQCFGITVAELEEALVPQARMAGWPMLAMSILSDAQYLLQMSEASAHTPQGAAGLRNESRQLMNRAKWCLSRVATEMRATQEKLDAEVENAARLLRANRALALLGA